MASRPSGRFAETSAPTRCNPRFGPIARTASMLGQRFDNPVACGDSACSFAHRATERMLQDHLRGFSGSITLYPGERTGDLKQDGD